MLSSLGLKMALLIIVATVFPQAIIAKPMDAKQPVIDFLAETVVFCKSRDSLASYKNMADVFDMDGLNNIVLAGECDFVPDGKYLRLLDYRCHAINSTDVIVAAVQGFTLWTFVSLVSRGHPDFPQATSENVMDHLRLSQDKQDRLHCP